MYCTTYARRTKGISFKKRDTFHWPKGNYKNERHYVLRDAENYTWRVAVRHFVKLPGIQFQTNDPPPPSTIYKRLAGIVSYFVFSSPQRGPSATTTGAPTTTSRATATRTRSATRTAAVPTTAAKKRVSVPPPSTLVVILCCSFVKL